MAGIIDGGHICLSGGNTSIVKLLELGRLRGIYQVFVETHLARDASVPGA